MREIIYVKPFMKIIYMNPYYLFGTIIIFSILLSVICMLMDKIRVFIFNLIDKPISIVSDKIEKNRVMKVENIKIAVIGLGYVGLPLARLFSTKFKTVGFDMNQSRVDALMAGHDATLEVSDELLQSAIKNGFLCTTNLEDIRDCNFM